MNEDADSLAFLNALEFLLKVLKVLIFIIWMLLLKIYLNTIFQLIFFQQSYDYIFFIWYFIHLYFIWQYLIFSAMSYFTKACINSHSFFSYDRKKTFHIRHDLFLNHFRDFVNYFKVLIDEAIVITHEF